jgi:hypothetical protein
MFVLRWKVKALSRGRRLTAKVATAPVTAPFPFSLALAGRLPGVHFATASLIVSLK